MHFGQLHQFDYPQWQKFVKGIYVTEYGEKWDERSEQNFMRVSDVCSHNFDENR